MFTLERPDSAPEDSDGELPDVSFHLANSSQTQRMQTNTHVETVELSSSDEEAIVSRKRLDDRAMEVPAKKIRSDFYSDSSDVEDVTMDKAQQGGTGAICTENVLSELSTNSKPAAKGRPDAAMKKAAQLALRHQKEVERERKKQEQLEKKQAKEREALMKRTLREARKNATPKECLKFVTVVMDPGLLRFPCGAAILSAIQDSPLKHDVQQQPLPNVITFFREVTEVKELGGNKVTTETRELAEDQVLLYLPVEEFINFLQPGASGGTKLRSYIEELQQLLEGREVSLLVQGLEKYYKGSGKGKRGRGKQTEPSRPPISKGDVDMVLVEAQIFTSCNIQLLEADAEVAKVIMQYAKSVAERPHKQERLQTGFSFHIDSGSSVKVTSDGTGLARVWRQQIQQFKNVSAEIANAIIAAYPTPRTLWEAYQTCPSKKEAELLLQDIMVRRGYGVMETNRRVGKEMSRRMFQLFMENNPETELS